MIVLCLSGQEMAPIGQRSLLKYFEFERNNDVEDKINELNLKKRTLGAKK